MSDKRSLELFSTITSVVGDSLLIDAAGLNSLNCHGAGIYSENQGFDRWTLRLGSALSLKTAGGRKRPTRHETA